jgi:hypothetical protein
MDVAGVTVFEGGCLKTTGFSSRGRTGGQRGPIFRHFLS